MDVVSDDPYSPGIAAYTLQKSGSSKKNNSLPYWKTFKLIKVIFDKYLSDLNFIYEDGMKFWSF